MERERDEKEGEGLRGGGKETGREGGREEGRDEIIERGRKGRRIEGGSFNVGPI